MITRFGMAPRVSGMSIEDFRHHWRTSHADAAGQIPGTLRYTQNHSLLFEGRYRLGYPGFDACSELDFESVAAMNEGFASPTYQTLVRVDEDAFVDKTRFSLVVTHPREVVEGPAHGIKLIRFFRRHPSAEEDSLHTALGAHGQTIASEVDRYVTYRPVEEPYAGPPASFDAIATAWLPDSAALDTLMASDSWQAAEWALAGVASGSVALAAETIEVI